MRTKITHISLKRKLSPQIYEFIHVKASDITLDSDDGVVCTLSEYFEKIEELIELIEKMNKERKKLEPSGAI